MKPLNDQIALKPSQIEAMIYAGKNLGCVGARRAYGRFHILQLRGLVAHKLLIEDVDLEGFKRFVLTVAGWGWVIDWENREAQKKEGR